MKYIWEPGDIKAGRYAYRPGTPGDLAYACSTAIKIGYLHGASSPERWIRVSLSDGMTLPGKTKEDLAAELTAAKYHPLPTSLLVKLVQHNVIQNEGLGE